MKTRVLIQPASKPYEPSPYPNDATRKIDPDWPTAFRGIQVWKCGGRRTDDGPLVYYKLTLWAFGSSELRSNKKVNQRWLPAAIFVDGPELFLSRNY